VSVIHLGQSLALTVHAPRSPSLHAAFFHRARVPLRSISESLCKSKPREHVCFAMNLSDSVPFEWLSISVMLSVRLLRKSWKVKNFKILDSKFSCGELFQGKTSFFLGFSEQPKERINKCTLFQINYAWVLTLWSKETNSQVTSGIWSVDRSFFCLTAITVTGTKKCCWKSGIFSSPFNIKG
jgi:hypothetical protein